MGVGAKPDGFSIGYVSLQTGLSTHVIRAWERRYQAVLPNRTSRGRRRFSQADVDRLALLKQLLDQGHRISTVADLNLEQLVDLAGAPNRPGPSRRAARPAVDASPTFDQPAALVDACMDAVRRLDGNRLHQRLQTGMLHLSRQALLETVVGPLMHQVGQQWAEGTLRIVHGHLAAVVVHALLNSMLATCFTEDGTLPCMLVATPAGQRCYLGALALSITAQDHGWKPAMLGYDLPAEEIAAACGVLNPQLIALSITCRVDDAFTHSELKRLCEMIDGRCSIIIGGQASHLYRSQIDSLGCSICASTTAMISQLH